MDISDLFLNSANISVTKVSNTYTWLYNKVKGGIFALLTLVSAYFVFFSSLSPLSEKKFSEIFLGGSFLEFFSLFFPSAFLIIGVILSLVFLSTSAMTCRPSPSTILSGFLLTLIFGLLSAVSFAVAKLSFLSLPLLTMFFILAVPNFTVELAFYLLSFFIDSGLPEKPRFKKKS